MKRPISPIALAMADPTELKMDIQRIMNKRKKPLKTMRNGRKKPRTAKQKAATRKLVAFNKKRFR